MSRFATRLCTGLVAAGAIVALTAGCGSGSDGHRAVDLVLTQDQLPDDFTVAKLGTDELEQVTDQLHDSTKDVEVTPGRCAAPGSMVSTVDPKTTGIMAATSEHYAISQSVQAVDAVDGGVDLQASRDRVVGPCAQVQMKFKGGPIKGADINVRHTVLSVPDIDADQLLAVHSTSTTVNGDKGGTRELLTGTAVVNGFLIAVEMTSIDDDTEALDRELFTRVLGRAVDRAAA